MPFADRVGPVLKEGRGFVEEFRAFIRRGNVIDLAVGIIIGAAFGKIVSSLVADVLMPPIGYVLGNVDFKDLALTIRPAQMNADGTVAAPAIVLSYGRFIQTIIDFLIIAFCVFLLVKVINRLQGPPPAEPPKPPPEEVQLLREIRDLLKNQPKQDAGPVP
jgi:large conductance mechanosensitive channel